MTRHEITNRTTSFICDADFVVCASDLGDGGWSLHAPGSTDDDIAEGIALPLVTGTGPITAADFDAARRALTRPSA